MILGLLAERGADARSPDPRKAELGQRRGMGRDKSVEHCRGLRKLSGEALIRAVREEQVCASGQRGPCTRSRKKATSSWRSSATPPLNVVFGSADPVSVVLLFAAGGNVADLRERLHGPQPPGRGPARRDGVRTGAAPRELLSPLAIAAFRREKTRLEAELRWHESTPSSRRTRTGRARDGGPGGGRMTGDWRMTSAPAPCSSSSTCWAWS